MVLPIVYPVKEIDLERWEDYFQNLYNSNETNDNLPNPSMIKETKIELVGQILKQ